MSMTNMKEPVTERSLLLERANPKTKTFRCSVTSHPRLTLRLNGEVVELGVAALYSRDDGVKEALVEPSSLASRTWSGQKSIVMGFVRESTHYVVRRDVRGL